MPIARRVYYQNVQVGDEVPSWRSPPIDRMQIARYVGAAGDFNPLYVDEPFAKAAGFRSVIVPGALALGAFSQMLGEWLKGPTVRKLQARYLKILWPGDVLVCRGRVVSRRREQSDYLIDIDLWIENQEGELVTRGTATAALFYSAQDEAQRLAGGPPLVVEEKGEPKKTEPKGSSSAKKDKGKSKR